MRPTTGPTVRRTQPRGMVFVWLVVGIVTMSCAGAAPPSNTISSAPAVPQQTTLTKRITAAIRGTPASLAQNRLFVPGSSGSVPGADALDELVHAGLAHWNADGALVPQLAEEAPSVENGLWRTFPDGRMQTTWRIRPTARWQDGTPVTSRDMVFTAAVEQDPETGIPRSAVYDLIESIEAPDASTVTVTWKRPYIEADAMFTHRFALPLPQHLLGAIYASDKRDVFATGYWQQEFIGAGPYRVQRWVPDSHVVLQANAAYVLGRPRIDEVEVKFIPDPTTLMANVLAGVQLTLGRALSFDQSIQMRDQWRDGKPALRPGAALPITPQFLKAQPAVVADVRFRRALFHAIDRQQLVDSLMAGQSQVAETFVSPADPAYTAVLPRVVRYEFDPRGALQIIEGLGYTRAPDRYFHDPANEKLSVQIYTAAQNDRNPKATAAVAGFWEQIGVGTEQVIIPIQRFQDVEYRAQFPAFEITATAGGTSARDLARYHSSSTPLPENQFRARGNASRYRSPELDALIDRYLSTIELSERREVLADIVRHQTENLTMMPLFYDVMATMVGQQLRNVTARGDHHSEAWNAQEWDIQR